MILSHNPILSTADDDIAIEALLDLVFGLSRRTKTSYRLREGTEPEPALSLVIRDVELGLVGSINFSRIAIGQRQAPALVLGPLAVHPLRQNVGIGRALMHEGMARAAAQGHKLVILIGDAPYYERVAFRVVPEGQIAMPGPVDPKRLLFRELQGGALAQAHGLALPPWRWREINGPRATT